MDNCVRNMNKHLKNFEQVAGQLTKVVIPIVDKAVKMSSEEPISAYSVFKQAKELVEKKKKKNSCDSANTKNVKRQVKKNSCARIGVGTKPAIKSKSTIAQRRVSANKNKANTCIKDKSRKTKQLNENRNVREKNFNGAEVLNLVDQLYSGNSKLTKSEKEKKKELEDYLTKQLEMDDLETEDDESFDSNCTSCSDTYSDETAVDESGRFSNDENLEEDTSTYDGNNTAAEALALTLVSKKRKNPSTLSATNTNPKAKKTKSSDTKPTARKSFPIVKADNVSDNKTSYNQHSLTSNIGSLKKSTPKAADLKVSTVSNVKLEPLSPPPNIIKLNSIEEGKRAFAWLLNPVTIDDFFAKYWEQKACLIKRQQSNYFNHLISFEAIDQMLLKNHVEFTKNIDVTSYKNGVRETLNPEGRALPPVVWHHYGNGCSIRLLNPQTFLPKLYTLCTTMQEYFHCLVGVNAYLTPPNSQGFAPHYDDIEAFVLQIEGRKLWKLYKPRSTSDTLPRYSSKNFTEQEIGEPVLEEILEPGDVLYFPRGTVHQASTESGHHSLHITLSVYQKQSFADLFEKMLPIMLQKAIASNVDLRKGLPLHVWQHAGVAYSDNFTKARADLKKKVTQLMHKCIRDMPLQDIIDAGIDQLAKRFQHEALPPEILPCEKLRTVFGSRSRASENGECLCDYDINERTNVRLLRANILRLVKEEEKIRIYYYLDNSMEYCEYEPNFIEIEPMEAASVEVLIKSYPQYVGVSELPLKSIEQRIDFATALWERGLLMMEKPFR